MDVRFSDSDLAFRDAHRQDRVFTRIAAEIDTAVLKALRDQQE